MTTFVTRHQQHGGESETTRRVVRDLYDRMLSDSHTWYYWKGYSTDTKAAECRLFTEIALASGWDSALSRHLAPNPAYKSLGTGRVEWSHFIRLAGETLGQSELTEAEQEQLFTLLTRSKATLADGDRARSAVGVFAAFPHRLTLREKDVLRLLAMGRTNPEIADELIISINTVTRHITNIFSKTSTRNRVEAAVYAAKRHLV